ncbi:MAG: hypothetical protein IJE08_15555 [Clostridia bacterium]|nr:hypothetical protein [Clostridia bacterium]
MKEDARKNIPSGQEIQNNELNEEQLDEVTGGLVTIRLLSADGISQRTGSIRQCASNPSHKYVARNANDVCPFCGAKDFIDYKGN